MLPSGMRAVSIDGDDIAVTTLGLLVRAGACHELYENLGVNHAIRTNIGMTSKNSTSFGIVRNIQQTGGRLDVLGTREYTLYTMSVARSSFANVGDFFIEAVSVPAFKAWEQSDFVHKQMAQDLAGQNNALKATELLHKAAYRNGLGNSIFSPAHMIGKHKPEMLQDFHHKTHTASRAILVAHGMDHRSLCHFGESLKMDKGHGNFDQP